MLKIVYNKNNGEIISAISADQNPISVYRDFGDDFINSLTYLVVDEVPQPLYHYYISNDAQVIKHDSKAIDEILRHGKVLTDDVRLLNRLQPSHEEIQKAENTIEILELLQEVL